MRTCHIVGAADFSPARFRPKPGDLVVAADAGLLALDALGVAPDLIIGDFDSLGYVPVGGRVERSPVEKDDTDTQLAARRAVELGCREILIFGGVGGKRLDHTLANIQTLAWAAQRGAYAYLVGDGFVLTALRGGKLRFDARYSGDFSAFCLGEDCVGVTERGLKYSLDGAVLSAGFPLGVSNSFTGAAAEISVERGTLTVYWRDDPALPLPEREDG